MPDEVRERIMELDGRELPYRLVRRKGRRSVALELEPRVGLSVLSPPRVPLREIDAILRRETPWLRRKLAAMERWEDRHPPRRFQDGDNLPLLGEQWRLRVRTEPGRRRPAIKRDVRRGGPGEITLIMPACVNDEERRTLAAASMERWYRRLARRLLEARVRHWEAMLGVSVKAISIRDNRSRWASCSSTGRLSFDWKIIMASPAVIDYLVVHEACHLTHHDHSPEFWASVEKILPSYRKHRAWLRKHGESLYL